MITEQEIDRLIAWADKYNIPEDNGFEVITQEREFHQDFQEIEIKSEQWKF